MSYIRARGGNVGDILHGGQPVNPDPIADEFWGAILDHVRENKGKTDLKELKNAIFGYGDGIKRANKVASEMRKLRNSNPSGPTTHPLAIKD